MFRVPTSVGLLWIERNPTEVGTLNSASPHSARCTIVSSPTRARVAQWIRAFASGAKGRRFDPCRGYQLPSRAYSYVNGLVRLGIVSRSRSHDQKIGVTFMALYEITTDNLNKIKETSFEVAGFRERSDLQRLLKKQIDVIAPETLVIAEEFGEWEESKRRIDLLGLDRDANLVVIELKRTDDGGHMELQAIRYAAMVSTMTFEKVVELYGKHLQSSGNSQDPKEAILEFLNWDEPDEELFAQDVRIVLMAANFSKELTTAVMWLNERDLNIRCIRLQPYHDNERVLIDVQQVIPLPEAAEYQIQIKEKEQKGRKERAERHGIRRKFWDSLLGLAEKR